MCMHYIIDAVLRVLSYFSLSIKLYLDSPFDHFYSGVTNQYNILLYYLRIY